MTIVKKFLIFIKINKILKKIMKIKLLKMWLFKIMYNKSKNNYQWYNKKMFKKEDVH